MSVELEEAVVSVELVDAALLLSVACGAAVDESAVVAAAASLPLGMVLEAVELSDFEQVSAIICTLVTLKLSPFIEPVNWTSWPLCELRSEVLPVSL